LVEAGKRIDGQSGLTVGPCSQKPSQLAMETPPPSDVTFVIVSFLVSLDFHSLSG